MVRPGKKLHVGDRVSFTEDGSLSAKIIEHSEGGTRIVRFDYDGDFHELLDRIGKIPLPPYIERESDEEDQERYQTVYCKEEGSVAAPTAGLHFTEELMAKALQKGVKIAYVTLHVGIGTFRPVKCENIEEHQMHFEEYEIDEENASIINETKKAGGRIISVGTTSTRTVESAAAEDGTVIAGCGSTGIFIYPGYRFKVIDSLITNFHLPKSTLLMLVSALYNRENILAAYQEAVEQKYRFFSYGDAMLIL
jgi:S-adenosylmethionine:tRNA ribosyltransferase-isomerase